METAIGICLVILVLGFTFGGGLSKDKKQQLVDLYKKQEFKIIELKQLRELDNKTIKDLQERLEKNGLDSSIG